MTDINLAGWPSAPVSGGCRCKADQDNDRQQDRDQEPSCPHGVLLKSGFDRISRLFQRTTLTGQVPSSPNQGPFDLGRISSRGQHCVSGTSTSGGAVSSSCLRTDRSGCQRSFRYSSRTRPEPGPRCCCLSGGLRQAERSPGVGQLASEGRPNRDSGGGDPVLIAMTRTNQTFIVRTEDAGQ